MIDERWQEIKTIWKQNQWLYILAGFIAGLLVEPLLRLVAEDAGSFLQTLVPEAIGILFTVLFIDRLYRRREAEREERELKAQLIRELGSSVNEVAKRAAEELRAQRWIWDGSLRKGELAFANLENVSSEFADLERASLRKANLRRATMRVSNLSRAVLVGANLQVVDLTNANLQTANLLNADLRRAYLEFADLQSVDLRGANMEGVDLQGANLRLAKLDNLTKLDETSILPDGTHWTPDTDMHRFTDPTHPDFWRSDDPDSPAYRSKQE